MRQSSSFSNRTRHGAAITIALAVCLLPGSALAQATAAAVDAADTSLPAQARGVSMGGLLRVERIQLDRADGPATLELERFRVFSHDAQIVLDDASVVEAPDTAYFRGFVDGDSQSIAVLSASRGGRMRGLVTRDGRLWMLEAPSGGALRSREVDVETELAPLMADFECATDGLPPVSDVVESALAGGGTTDAAPVLAANASYTARVAIETDWEFFNLKGRSVTATLDYIGDIFAFASTIYENEVATSLHLSYVSLWTQGATEDPWTATSGTSAALSEYRSYWNSNRSGVSRSIGHMLSGKGLGGGIAYVGVLCNSSAGYGLSASLGGGFDINNPTSMWDIIVVTHEIGHNFNSPHTHSYCNLGGNANPVDACVPSQYGTACNGQSGQYPAGCSGGSQYCGTIMSYCHLISGGYQNIALTFGLNHPYGIEPDRVPGRMYDHVVARSSCLGLTSGGPRLTIEVEGDGKVTASPPGVDCEDYCEQDYDSNTVVTLTPSSDTGAAFVGWTGDADCDDGSVTMAAAKTCVATFGASLCGNGQIDNGEECDGADLGGAVCDVNGCDGTVACTSSCTLDFSGCAPDGYCDAATESCATCGADCLSDSGGSVCGNGVCEIGAGEDCVSCPTDCAGVQNGKPSNRWCCGGGTGEIGCEDNRCGGESACNTDAAVTACCGDGVCQSGEPNLLTCSVDECSGGGPVCGDGLCESPEDYNSCAADCDPPSFCGDGVCDADEDSSNCPADCSVNACVNDGGAADGESCSSNTECCSDKCRGPRNRKTCKAA
jgi:hypothetical protein